MIPLDPRDQKLFSALPLVLVPHFGTLPSLEIGHTRLLVAQDGLYIEARSRVLEACGRIAAAQGLPFGKVDARWSFSGRAPDRKHLIQAEQMARAASPNEWAGVLMRRPTQDELIVPEVYSTQHDAIHYSAAGIDPLDLLWDLHSHGLGEAFFSEDDDRDDLSNPSPVFFASVIGQLGSQQKASWVTRLVVAGRCFDPHDMLTCEHLGFRQPVKA